MKIRSPSLSCEHCGKVITIGSLLLAAYFSEVDIICSRCENDFDPRERAINALQSGAQLFQGAASALIGGMDLWTNISVEPGKHLEIDFREYGIPEGSTVLFSVVTPQVGGGCFPLISIGQSTSYSKFSNKLWIYGAPVANLGSGPTETTLSVYFVPHAEDEIALINLAKSVDALMQSRLENMLLPAAAAVEDVAKNTVRQFLERYALPPEVPSLATVFNITLPMIADREGAPRIRRDIMNSLTKLRSWRNKQAHEGVAAEDLQLPLASEVLCDAMLTVRYLQSLITGEIAPRLFSEQPLRY